MKDKMMRQTIVTLHQSGKSRRQISSLLRVSRNTVKKILLEGVEPSARKLAREQDERVPVVSALLERVNGNAVRVQEILKAEYGQDIAYSTLTRLLREASLRKGKERYGEYVFEPGAEMQHDTSPHRVKIGGKVVKAQCASLVFAFSRKIYIQYYPRFTRFETRAFLLSALEYMGGSCRQCVIDNTNVVLASGSGANAIISPEMKNFGQIFGFGWKAHAIMHSDRKGRVERPFHYIEHNFLAGREFVDWNDLNRRAREWCTEYANQKVKRVLGMNPETAFVKERPFLQSLPAMLPPVYEHCSRKVDSQGYVSVDCNRYSVPERLVEKQVDVYRYIDEIRICYRHEEVARHPRVTDRINARRALEGHHPRKMEEKAKESREQTERALRGLHEVLDAYLMALKAQARGKRSLVQLLHLRRTYPWEAFLTAVKRAHTYGLYDMGRLEELVLKQIAGDFFSLAESGEPSDE